MPRRKCLLVSVGASPTIVDYYRADAIPANETDRALNGQVAKKMPIFKIPGVKALARIPGEPHGQATRGSPECVPPQQAEPDPAPVLFH